MIYGGAVAFDARRSCFSLGMSPEASEINGVRVGAGDYQAVFAVTEDAGATWTIGAEPPPPNTTRLVRFQSPQRFSALTTAGLAVTSDGRRPHGCCAS
jgi:hypothetical protein